MSEIKPQLDEYLLDEGKDIGPHISDRYRTDEDLGKGHVCWGIWQRWWRLSKQTTGWGFILHLLSSRWWSPSFRPASPESEMSIFESLYIERRNSHPECGVARYFWLFVYFHGSSSGPKSQVNRRPFALIACTDTILGGHTSPGPR